VIKDLRAGDPASVGPYKLLGRLGAGGMGEVYLAKSPGGRLVAIKLIRPELAEERGFRSRFSSEVSAARNVSGIYTAAVVDADPEAELPWMATVYVAGPSLTDAVEDNGALPLRSVLALTAGLAEALQAIHRAGLVHRDLKPSNVLLATDGPRVIDFGISLALERSMMTATGMVMGSPGFMSPEQARGQREVGAPTDMFSFGAVLAFAATGNSPFGTGPTPALLYRVVNEEPDLAAVPARLRPLVEQCLAKDPAGRPTPAEVLESLGDDVEVLTGEWLPQPIAETMIRYSPTLQTPLPPALREAGQPRAEAEPVSAESVPAALAAPGAAVAGAAVAGAAVAGAAVAGAAAAGLLSSEAATPAPRSPGSGASGPVGFEPTVLAASIPPSAAAAPVSATRVEHSLLPETSLVPVSGPFTAAGRDIPGGTGGMPPGRPPSQFRRWLWTAVAAAAAVIVAVVAVLLTSHSGGTSKVGVNPTASLAGDTTQSPTPTGAGAPSKNPTKKPTATTSQPAGFAPGTQPSATAGSTASSSPTRTPTPTTSHTTTATPTSSPSSTTTTTTPTVTPTATTTTAPTQPATSNPTTAPSTSPTP
jgi:eukaryotic-like serine/threonine-protein kinase